VSQASSHLVSVTSPFWRLRSWPLSLASSGRTISNFSSASASRRSSGARSAGPRRLVTPVDAELRHVAAHHLRDLIVCFQVRCVPLAEATHLLDQLSVRVGRQRTFLLVVARTPLLLRLEYRVQLVALHAEGLYLLRHAYRRRFEIGTSAGHEVR
jgi:hypothetical protein